MCNRSALINLKCSFVVCKIIIICNSSAFIPFAQESRELAEQKQKEKDDLMREHKKSERERMKSGKKAFHIKKCKCYLYSGTLFKWPKD